MRGLVAEASVTLSRAAERLRQLCEHFALHDAVIAALPDERRRMAFPFGEALLQVVEGSLAMRVEAPDAAGLATLKLTLVGHLEGFTAGEALSVTWQGDSAGTMAPPSFRRMEVLENRAVTPHLRRLTLGGSGLAHFADPGNLHVKLLIPQPGTEPVWPVLDESGRVQHGDAARRPVVRTYTLRRVHAEAGRVEIDLVAHGDGSPGSAFALGAAPGDAVGMMGPGGGGARPAAWTLLAGDETALPAIARILEEMPPHARGEALVEVADAAERQDLLHPPGVALRWLSRDGAPAGTTTLLEEAVRAAAWPGAGVPVFAWAGCEFVAFRALRRFLREERGLDRHSHLVVAYWRRGLSEGQFKKAAD